MSRISNSYIKNIHMGDEDTIAAISTPRGTGAVSVIRISGLAAFAVAFSVFTPEYKSKNIEDRRMTLGFVYKDENKIDQVLLTKFTAPNSFTGEDMVELSCHGGIYITAVIMELLLSKGARPAEPGEFTKRAFLNGRIDLMQAEAVQELIFAKSERAGQIALKTLEGKISEGIRSIKDDLTDLLAEINVSIDYPEYDNDEPETENLLDLLKSSRDKIDELLATFKRGNVYREGVRIAIVGRPNVGKSTFLNSFIGKNRAIVTDIPGTTRDTLEELLEIGGIPVTLIDTAGIRETDNVIEKIGQERTREALKSADMLLLVLDSNEGIFKEDEEVLRRYSDKHVILLLNKIDIIDEEKLEMLEKKISHSHVVRTSFINNTGILEIEKLIEDILDIDDNSGSTDMIIYQLRQKEQLKKAGDSINNAIEHIQKGMPSDMTDIPIRMAASALGELFGDVVSDEIIDKIFSKFCLGK